MWAGHAVNYAAKAAQQTEPDKILVTGSVWDAISTNDFLAFSCGCSGGRPDAGDPSLLWTEHTLDKIPDGERHGQALKSEWCAIHGEEFCNQVLAGQTSRDDVGVAARSQRNLLASGTLEKRDASKARGLARDLLQAEAKEVMKHKLAGFQ